MAGIGNKMAFSTTNTSVPSTGEASPSGDIVLSEVYLHLAVESNEAIIKTLQAQFAAGSLKFRIPYTWCWKNSGGAQNSITAIQIQITQNYVIMSISDQMNVMTLTQVQQQEQQQQEPLAQRSGGHIIPPSDETLRIEQMAAESALARQQYQQAFDASASSSSPPPILLQAPAHQQQHLNHLIFMNAGRGNAMADGGYSSDGNMDDSESSSAAATPSSRSRPSKKVVPGSERLRAMLLPIKEVMTMLQEIPLLNEKNIVAASNAVDKDFVPPGAGVQGVAEKKRMKEKAMHEANLALQSVIDEMQRYTSFVNKACEAAYKYKAYRAYVNAKQDVKNEDIQNKMDQRQKKEEERIQQDPAYAQLQERRKRAKKRRLGTDDGEAKAPSVFDNI